MLKNKNKRPKQNESTLCTWTTNGEEIKEGDILGYGDNYPCIVFYNKFTAQFVAIEFGNKDVGLFREHELLSYTSKWEYLGNIDYPPIIDLKGYPKNFDYTKSIKKIL